VELSKLANLEKIYYQVIVSFIQRIILKITLKVLLDKESFNLNNTVIPNKKHKYFLMIL
jgi:hypothetical protein